MRDVIKYGAASMACFYGFGILNQYFEPNWFIVPTIMMLMIVGIFFGLLCLFKLIEKAL